MTDFNMPPAEAGFEKRGGWVLRALMSMFALTEAQAAGIVGNLGYESIGFKTLQEIAPTVHGSRGGYGWAQWTGPRRDDFEYWCKENGLDPASDEANFGFLCVELETTQKHALNMVKLTTGLGTAVFTFGFWFERPGGTTSDHLPGYEGRLEYANRALHGYHSTTVMPQTVPQPGDSFWTRLLKTIGLVE